MSKEVKAIFLAALTISIYAISIFIKDGSLVFPYPLNSFVFLVVALQFSYWHRAKLIPILLVVSTGVFASLSNQILWEVVLPIEELDDFMAQPWIHWFKLLFIVSLLFWGIITLFQQKKQLPTLLTGIGTVLLGYGFFSSYEVLILIGYLLIACSITIKPGFKSFDMLWILLFILELSKWATYHLA